MQVYLMNWLTKRNNTKYIHNASKKCQYSVSILSFNFLNGSEKYIRTLTGSFILLQAFT